MNKRLYKLNYILLLHIKWTYIMCITYEGESILFGTISLATIIVSTIS